MPLPSAAPAPRPTLQVEYDGGLKGGGGIKLMSEFYALRGGQATMFKARVIEVGRLKEVECLASGLSGCSF